MNCDARYWGGGKFRSCCCCCFCCGQLGIRVGWVGLNDWPDRSETRRRKFCVFVCESIKVLRRVMQSCFMIIAEVARAVAKVRLRRLAVPPISASFRRRRRSRQGLQFHLWIAGTRVQQPAGFLLFQRHHTGQRFGRLFGLLLISFVVEVVLCHHLWLWCRFFFFFFFCLLLLCRLSLCRAARNRWLETDTLWNK